MTARKGSSVHFGTNQVILNMNLPQNLLSRQETPMLRTNLSATGRDTYDRELLNSLLIATFTSQFQRIPIGGYTYEMRFRVAGRIAPVPAVPVPRGRLFNNDYSR